MKISKKQLIVLIAPALIILIPYIIFLCRRPVLIVSDMGFIPLYGEARIRSESRSAALSLYRRVKHVLIADDADEAAVPHAINDSSSRPHCVLLPHRFARSAPLYREQKPDIPIIILQGRVEEGYFSEVQAQDYFIYKTDISTDFYAAAMAALILDTERSGLDVEGKGRIVIFYDSNIRRQGREAVLRATETQENPPDVSFYTAYSQFISHNNITCSIMTGTGIQFMENHLQIPVIMFTWTDPGLIPENVAVVFDDSPPAQVRQAVKMAEKGVTEGVIPSKIIYKNPKKFDRKLLRKMLKMEYNVDKEISN